MSDLEQRARECLDQRFNITAQLSRQECCEVMADFARGELEAVKQMAEKADEECDECKGCGTMIADKIGERQR